MLTYLFHVALLNLYQLGHQACRLLQVVAR